MAGPEFATRLAVALEEIGCLFRSLGRGKGLKIIVAAADGEGRAIEFRLGPGAEIPEGQVVTVREGEIDQPAPEDEVPTFHVLPVRGIELVRPVELSDSEAEVIDLFTRERKKLQAKEIAPKVGRSNDSRFRNFLSYMRKRRGLLDNDVGRGYYPTILGLESLRVWREQQDSLFGEPA